MSVSVCSQPSSPLRLLSSAFPVSVDDSIQHSLHRQGSGRVNWRGRFPPAFSGMIYSTPRQWFLSIHKTRPIENTSSFSTAFKALEHSSVNGDFLRRKTTRTLQQWLPPHVRPFETRPPIICCGGHGTLGAG